VAWTRSYSTLSESLPYASEAVVDGHGNLYVAGVTNLPGAGGWTEAFVVKLSARGDLLWERTWGRAVEASMAVALTVTPAGRAYCAGWVSRGGDLVTPYVRAFNGSGRKLWSRGFAASSGARWASDLVQAPGGAIVVVGGRMRGETSQGVVEKFDGAGRTLWRRAVSTGAEGSSLGSAAVDDRGRVFAAGVYGSPESGRGGALVIGLSSSGRARWTSQWHDQAWPGEIVVAGPRLYMDASLAPADAGDHALIGAQCLAAGTGAQIWRREYDTGAGSTRAEVKDLTVVSGRSVYVAATVWVDGRFTDALFLRLSP
jgi:outer membrane protein assembly factor BamB